MHDVTNTPTQFVHARTDENTDSPNIETVLIANRSRVYASFSHLWRAFFPNGFYRNAQVFHFGLAFRRETINLLWRM